MNFSERIIVFGAFVLIGFVALISAALFGGKTDDENALIVLNYGDYIERDVLKEFEDKTGTRVIYEEYETPESMYAKYKSGSIDYDLICSADYIIEKLIGEGELLEYERENIPNIKYLDGKYDRFLESFDPGARRAVPYFLGTVGLLYNTRYVDSDEAASWNILWEEKYKNRIIMENSVRDCMIAPLRLMGESINTTDGAVLLEAQRKLLEQKPLNYAYLSDDSMYEMIMENANIALIYSGEANAAMLQNEDLEYQVPIEGSNLWMDAWFIPKTCRHKEEAEAFIDFMCDPEIAYRNWDHVYYTTPNTGVYDMLDEEEKQDRTMFPTDDILERCEVFSALSDEDMGALYELWKKLKVGV